MDVFLVTLILDYGVERIYTPKPRIQRSIEPLHDLTRVGRHPEILMSTIKSISRPFQSFTRPLKQSMRLEI